MVALASLAVWPYRLPLRLPLRGPAGVVHERRGYLVAVADTDGVIGWGEAAPAYWVGDESLATCQHALQRLARSEGLAGIGLDALRAAFADAHAGSGVHERALAAQLHATSPAACAALETALLDLHARRRGVSVADLLAATPQRTVAVNGLVVGSTPTDVARRAGDLLAAGFSTLKLKVGATAPADDVARIAALRDATHSTVRIRLDANGAWDLSTACHVLTTVAGPDIEYVEEPLHGADGHELRALRQRTGVAVALDESLRTPDDLDRFAAAEALDAVVLKLARLGGPSAVLALAHRADACGLRVTCTDAIDTVVGRAAAIHTAAARPGPAPATGLGGLEVLAADVRPDVALTPTAVCPVLGPGLGPVTPVEDRAWLTA